MLRRRRQSRRQVGAGAGIAQALLNQRFQRIDGFGRVEVKHQPVLVGGHRLEGKNLRHGLLFEVDDQTHHIR